MARNPNRYTKREYERMAELAKYPVDSLTATIIELERGLDDAAGDVEMVVQAENRQDLTACIDVSLSAGEFRVRNGKYRVSIRRLRKGEEE